ncbi:MAG: hypothetical protein IT366_03570 [Candidatus Hydrogenedentes bacterium]|nr:hypothetical protein [Candidatus Hydrogenedentota bacterium]
MLKQFIGGLLLGSALTIAGGLFVGPNITIADVGSGNVGGGDGDGRYQLHVDEHDGTTTYSISDVQTGKEMVMVPANAEK